MNRIGASLFAAALLLVLPQATRADEFSRIQNSPNTYWVPAVPATAYYPAPGYAAGPPPPYYYGGPSPYYYGPPPAPPGPPVRVYIGIPGLFFGFHIH